MPFTTYANQKTVLIHKPAMNDDFLQIQNADWMEANKELGDEMVRQSLEYLKEAIK